MEVLQPLEVAYKRRRRNITITVRFKSADNLEDVKRAIEAQGAGFYEGAFIATVLVLVAESLFGVAGAKIGHSEIFKSELKYTEKTALNYVMRYCKNNHMMIRNLEVTGSVVSDKPVYSVAFHVRSHKKFDHNEFISHIRSINGVLEASIAE